MKDGRVQIVSVISGSGTDNEAVLKAHKTESIPRADIAGIIGTAPGLEGFERARKLEYTNHIVVDFQKLKKEFGNTGPFSFKEQIARNVTALGADLMLSLGCKYKLPVIPGVRSLNIHPQNTDLHGGYRMVGLESHKHFLTHEVQDLIYRGRKKKTDEFYVTITIHEITSEWDEGRPFVRYDVKIPTLIITNFIDERVNLEESAKLVQAYVLKHEHRILPHAVNLAVQEIIIQKENEGGD